MTLINAEDRFRSKLLLPEEFWQAHPVLEHVRESARKRMAPPDLVLGAVLARIAVLADPRLRIPPRPGSITPLGMFVCGTAGSSGGKTTANGVACDLLPYQFDDCVLEAAPATGEALLELFWRDEEDENGRPMRMRGASSALIGVDEGSLIEKLDGRSGNTLLPFLLTMWSGATVGTDTLGTLGKRGVQRRLQRHTYVLSTVISLQPKKAAHLLSQRDSGFAQRFLWLSDKDPGLQPGVPDDHRIVPLQFQRRWADADRRINDHCDVLEVRRTDEIEVELYEAMWRKRQEWYEEDELAGHDQLNRLKVAHNLALLLSEGFSPDIDEQHWALSGMVSATSCANRDNVQGVLAGVEKGKRRARQEEQVETALRIDMGRDDLLKLKCRRAVIRLLRDSDDGSCAIGGRSVTKNLRPYLDEVLQEMAHDEVIRRGGDRYYLQ